MLRDYNPVNPIINKNLKIKQSYFFISKAFWGVVLALSLTFTRTQKSIHPLQPYSNTPLRRSTACFLTKFIWLSTFGAGKLALN